MAATAVERLLGERLSITYVVKLTRLDQPNLRRLRQAKATSRSRRRHSTFRGPLRWAGCPGWACRCRDTSADPPSPARVRSLSAHPSTSRQPMTAADDPVRETGCRARQTLASAVAPIVYHQVGEGLAHRLGSRPIDSSECPQHCQLALAQWPLHASTVADPVNRASSSSGALNSAREGGSTAPSGGGRTRVCELQVRGMTGANNRVPTPRRVPWDSVPRPVPCA